MRTVFQIFRKQHSFQPRLFQYCISVPHHHSHRCFSSSVKKKSNTTTPTSNNLVPPQSTPPPPPDSLFIRMAGSDWGDRRGQPVSVGMQIYWVAFVLTISIGLAQEGHSRWTLWKNTPLEQEKINEIKEEKQDFSSWEIFQQLQSKKEEP